MDIWLTKQFIKRKDIEEMELTAEQEAIIRSTGPIKINAVAGSGKTTTIIEYAKARPKSSRILYLAFNKSVRLEAIRKFEAAGLSNVQVETAHSLAYKHIVYKSNYVVRKQAYQTHEIAALLKIKGTGEKHTEYVLANHISKFIAYFCNSTKQKVQELNYLDVVSDAKAQLFVKQHYAYILQQTRQLLGKMDSGEIEITHDFYLKKFQLLNPQLNYDYILFDEGQDASPAMLALFFRQQATKVIVGDTHQQIYGWRYAVNSLEQADYTTFQLSNSFRYPTAIAQLATSILSWKSLIGPYKAIAIKGFGHSKQQQVKAIIARTNLGLLAEAIDYMSRRKSLKKVYFEGNFNSYTYADEGASLYDILNLSNGNRKMIKDALIKEMRSMEDLEHYIEQTEDMQLGMMIEIVKDYGNAIPRILKDIREKQVEKDDKAKAEIIFSTVHRCKGMEYDVVQLVNDFITEEKLQKLKNDGTNTIPISKINEEINLLYVAVTRTKNVLHIPETLLPKDFPDFEQIKVIPVITEENKQKGEPEPKKGPPVYVPNYKELATTKTYTVATAREKNTAAYKTWSDEADLELAELYAKGFGIRELARHFGRSTSAIKLRITKLNLTD